MKLQKTIIKSGIVISLVTSTALYATDGDTLIGVGAKTRSMGGAGIAFSHGTESTLVNPALITSVKDTEISIGGTLFLPDVETMRGSMTNYVKSDADVSMIPAVSIVSHLDNGIHIGAGMYGTAGMGTDFRGKNANLMDMETTLQLMQFVTPIAYKKDGLSIAFAPILQYGSLDIHYKSGATSVGDGQHQDFGVGASIGATYDFGNGFSIGAVYKSKIKMDYKGSIPTATRGMGMTGFSSHLDQPAEFGVGIGYKNGHHGIAIDWKKIKWGSAVGYKDFNWKDQDIFAIGYQYDAGVWSARIGFNHATNPIKSSTDGRINTFNLLGFPATSQNHITAGASYKFNDNFTGDFSAVYAFNKSSSLKDFTGGTIKNKHKELSFTFQLNYKF